MKRLLSTAALALCISAPAQATEIDVAYAYSSLFDPTFEEIMQNFTEAHPDITVNFRTTYEEYEDGTNTVLREAVSGDLPDVTLQGLNRQAILVDRGIARSLEPFIEQESDFQKDGYHEAMLELSTFDGEVYGLPFAVSTPIGYYNMDILNEAGVEEIPETWDGIVEVCQKINANTDHEAIFWYWNITGNWFLQSLLWSQGEPTIADGRFNFDNEAGLKSLQTMEKIFDGCEMKNYSNADARKSFSSGQIGMYFTSTSSVGFVDSNKTGDWTFRTAPFQGIDGTPEALPAGGNAAMLVSDSEDPEVLQAAWTFVKFITSGQGAAAVARTTGYIPPNKAANEEILVDFYEENPNKETAVKQLPLLSEWFAYPGDNGLAITQTIEDHMESILVGDVEDMEALQQQMVDEVNELLPEPEGS
ncbi:MAG: ABC transporter substrate-binding protein [Pseudomonadota bacterium]